MATSSLQLRPINALCTPQAPKRWNNLSDAAYCQVLPAHLSSDTKFDILRGIRMEVLEEECEVNQMRDMAAARKRWEDLVRDGKINVLSPREAGYTIQLSSKTLLDVRPSTEQKKVDGGVAFLYYLIADPLRFVSYYIMLVTKTCFGFKGAWRLLKKRTLKEKGSSPLNLLELGTFQNFLDQQRAAAANEGLGCQLVFSGRLIGLIVAVDALFLGVQQAGRYLRDSRSH